MGLLGDFREVERDGTGLAESRSFNA